MYTKKAKSIVKRFVAVAMSVFMLTTTISVGAVDGVSSNANTDNYEFPYYYYADVNTGNYEVFDWNGDSFIDTTYYYDSQGRRYVVVDGHYEKYCIDSSIRVADSLYSKSELKNYNVVKYEDGSYYLDRSDFSKIAIIRNNNEAKDAEETIKHINNSIPDFPNATVFALNCDRLTGNSYNIAIRLNPSSDKDKNTQPDNYDDSAVSAVAVLYEQPKNKNGVRMQGEWTPVYGYKPIYSWGGKEGVVFSAWAESYTNTTDNDWSQVLHLTVTPEVDKDYAIAVIPINVNKKDFIQNGYQAITPAMMSTKYDFDCTFGVFTHFSNYYYILKDTVDNVSWYNEATGKIASSVDCTPSFSAGHYGTEEGQNRRGIYYLNMSSGVVNSETNYSYDTSVKFPSSKGVNLYFESAPDDFDFNSDFYIRLSSIVSDGGVKYKSLIKNENDEILDSYVYEEKVHNFDGNNDTISIFPTVSNLRKSYSDYGRDIYDSDGSFGLDFGLTNDKDYRIEIIDSSMDMITFTVDDGSGIRSCSIKDTINDNVVCNVKLRIVKTDKEYVPTKSTDITDVYGKDGLPSYGVLIENNMSKSNYMSISNTTTSEPFVADYYVSSKIAAISGINFGYSSGKSYTVPNCTDVNRKYSLVYRNTSLLDSLNYDYGWLSVNKLAESGIADDITDTISKKIKEELDNSKFYTEKGNNNIAIIEDTNGSIQYMAINNKYYHFTTNLNVSFEEAQYSVDTDKILVSDPEAPTMIGIHPVQSKKLRGGGSYGDIELTNINLSAPTNYKFDYIIAERNGYSPLKKVVQLDTNKEYEVKDQQIQFTIDNLNNKLDINRLVYGKDIPRFDRLQFEITTGLGESGNSCEADFFWDWNNNAVGKVNMSNIVSALIINVDDIIDETDTSIAGVDLNIDLNTDKEVMAYSMLGTVEDGIFTAHNQQKGDWVNVVYTTKNQIGSNSYNYSNQPKMQLSPKYTYTLHAHIKKGDVIVIVPMDTLTTIKYDISVRNYTMYNIDRVSLSPVVPITRTVDNNIHFKGDTSHSFKLDEYIQTVNLTFKKIIANQSQSLVKEKNTVKSLPVTLIDYDFGNMNDFDLSKQVADFKFSFDSQDNGLSKINAWSNKPVTNIVKDELSEDGQPVFNFTTPFKSMFSLDKEADKNGNTKQGYKTQMEFLYDENTKMYSYNSTLYASVYNKDSNIMELYNAPIGIDNWGMQGAGFFPLNSFSDSNKWGTDTKYNSNIALIDQSNVNYHYGMALSADFEVPEGFVTVAKDGTVSDTVFNFSGDDDVWVFVDGKLVLDIGGIHEAMDGNINFTKGTYTVNGTTKDLTEKLLNFETDDWAKGTSHTLNIFYLERGGTLSNNLMSFNMIVPKFNIVYDSNGAVGTVVDDNNYKRNDKAIILSGDKLNKDGYEFISWNTNPDGTGTAYNADDILVVNDDIILYAQWQEKTPEESSKQEESSTSEPSEPEQSNPEPTIPDIYEPSKPQSEQNSTNNAPTGNSVATSDDTNNIVLIAILLSSLMLAVVLSCNKKKSDRKK